MKFHRAIVPLAAAAVACVGLAAPAGAATLPNGHKAVSDSGLTAQLGRTGESAMAAPSMAANGIGRSAVVSGNFTAKFNKSVAGRLRVGYVVGCQVTVGTLTAGISGNLSMAAPSVSGSVSFPLAPGQIKAVLLSAQAIQGKNAQYQYSGLEVEAQGCGGYASARSYATIEAAENFSIDSTTNTNNIGGTGAYVQSTLYGKPFSLS
ncbi:MspA family porin [Gordonia sp. DT218]|uniref:MspA family porin n=1 Tax=Gordonia sp. DT218 TaxID=3416659 RepID=UPI003CF5A394